MTLLKQLEKLHVRYKNNDNVNGGFCFREGLLPARQPHLVFYNKDNGNSCYL